MFFESWSEFINMGGYGFYVWLSYAISFVALLILGVQSVWARKQVLREVWQQQQRETRLQQAKQRGNTL